MLYSWILILIIFSIIITSEIYFLGKYISIKQDIFKNNIYGIICIGFSIYFLITFILLFPFIWLGASKIYLVVVFFLKDIIQISFLILRRNTFQKMNWNIKEIILILIFSISILFIFNFPVQEMRELHFQNNDESKQFQTWFSIENILNNISKIDISFIKKWFGGFISSFIGIVVVNLGLTFFVKKNNILLSIFSCFVTLAIIIGFNFGNQLENLISIFLIIFSIIISINIVLYSRRRYGVLFGITTFALWSFSSNYFLIMIILALITAFIYVIFQKPKSLMIWVQLFSPLIILSTLWINDFSKILGIIITLFSIFIYIFILGVGRIETLENVNKLIIKTRFVFPIIILLLITSLSFVLGFKTMEDEINAVNLLKDIDFIFDSYNKIALKYVQYSIYGLIALISILFVTYQLLINKKISSKKESIFLIFIIFFVLFSSNPALYILLNKIKIIGDQVHVLNSLMMPIITIYLVSSSFNISNKIIYKIKEKNST